MYQVATTGLESRASHRASHESRDEAAIKQWQDERWPASKKKPKRARLPSIGRDEAGFYAVFDGRADVGALWADAAHACPADARSPGGYQRHHPGWTTISACATELLEGGRRRVRASRVLLRKMRGHDRGKSSMARLSIVDMRSKTRL